ncbi:MAG: zinc-dependent alcohol dehydrogenase, partial [Anaerolineaceae bacterium]
MIPKRMKAVVMTNVGNIELHEYDVPQPAADEVLIQTKSNSICTVDQRPYRGLVHEDFPRVAGHEGSGIIVSVGACVKSFKVGDRVAIFRNRCGICQNCILGIARCLSGGDPHARAKKTYTMEDPNGLEGSFAQYVVRKESGIYKIADTTPYEFASLTEPLSDVVKSVRRSRLCAGETCVIIGAGIMGLLHTQVAKNVGARVIVSEIDAIRRENAKEAGADIVINPQEVDPVKFVMDLTNGRGVDVVFFAIAISKAFEQCYALLSNAGRIMIY